MTARRATTKAKADAAQGNRHGAHRSTLGARDRPPLMPSDVSNRVGFFDRFAGYSADTLGRATFFTFCVVLVILWAPTILFLHGNVNTWQLIINTITTIITFLMVALLQNSQTRNDHAFQHKVNAIAKGLADLMAHQHNVHDATDNNFAADILELLDAVGLEEYESTGRHD
jgi:low affinity Fe/Cu permease